MENEFQKRRSLRCGLQAETQLQEEVRSLRCQLVKAEKLDPVRIDSCTDRQWRLIFFRTSCGLCLTRRLIMTSWPRTWPRPSTARWSWPANFAVTEKTMRSCWPRNTRCVWLSVCVCSMNVCVSLHVHKITACVKKELTLCVRVLPAVGPERVPEPAGAAADPGQQHAAAEEHSDPEPDERAAG